MDNICRLCSSHCRAPTSVFDSKNGKLVADLITLICPIKIELSDELPKTICSLCWRIVLEAVELREKSIATDQNLRRRLGGKESQNSSTSKASTQSKKLNQNPIKLEKDPSIISYIDQSLVGHEDFHDYDADDNDDEDNSEYMNYEQPSHQENSGIVNYEPRMKLQKRDQNCVNIRKRTIEDDIDGMTDLSELKIVMKTFNKRLIKVENALKNSEGTEERIVNRGDFLMNKISSVPEFDKFVEDISLSKELREYLISYWKVIPHGSRQSPENGKVYAILLSLFDEDFLCNNVKWGHGCKKENSKDSQNEDGNIKTVVLKTADHFVDMIKEALGLEKDANVQIASIFKNLFRNKIKRQMIKGTAPADIGQVSQPIFVQAANDQM